MKRNASQFAQAMIDSGLYVETKGQNRGPTIDELNLEYGYPLGSSWCILFIVRAFDVSWMEHGKPKDVIRLPKTAGSQYLLSWFKKKGWTSTDPQDLLNWKGALAIRTDPGGKRGHGVLVKARFTKDGKIVAIGTSEGNTDENGGSNGDRAANRRRKIPLTPYKWTFCNTSFIIGGAYWK